MSFLKKLAKKIFVPNGGDAAASSASSSSFSSFSRHSNAEKYIFAVAGDDGVGKSHIEKTLNSDEFKEVRAAFGFRTEQRAAESVRFISRVPMGFSVDQEEVIGNVVVVDVTKRESFDGLNRHVASQFGVPFVIVANKCDLIDDRVVTLEELEKYAEEHHTKVFEGGYGLENNYFQAVGYLLEQSVQVSKYQRNPAANPLGQLFFDVLPLQGDETKLTRFLDSHPVASANTVGGLTKSAAKV